MEIGNRIIYDQDGEIVYQTGEMQGDVLPRKEITKLHFADLEYGAINEQTHRIIGINVETKQPILEEIDVPRTQEEIELERLQKELLDAQEQVINLEFEKLMGGNV